MQKAARPFRYFVKVGGIAEKWMPLPWFTKLQCQSGTGLFDGGLVDIADSDPAPKRCRPVAVARPIPQAPPVKAHSVAPGVPGVAAEANRCALLGYE